jgi:hypothetical protein
LASSIARVCATSSQRSGHGVALLGGERHALLLGLPDREARVAGPLLVLGVLVGTHAEDVAVEGAGAVGVLGRDAEEVESFDRSHAPTLSRITARGDRSGTDR